MKISDSNPVQFWLTGKAPFNDVDIYGIDKQFFIESFLTSDSLRTDIKPDKSVAQTYLATTTYNIGDRVYSTVNGLRFISLTDANINHNPAYGGSSAFWDLDISRPAFSLLDTYQINDQVVAINPDGNRYVYVSLTDSNLGNIPNSSPTKWVLLAPEDPSVYKLAAYIGDVYNQAFDFNAVRSDAPNQFAEFDFSILPVLVSNFLRLKIQTATLKPFIAPVAELGEWILISGTWTSRTSETFRRVTSAGVDGAIYTYELMRAKAGTKIKLTYRVEVVTGFAPFGSLSISFQATDNADVSVGTTVISIPAFTAVGVYDVTETITLTSDATRLKLNASWIAGTGASEFKISLITGVSDVDDTVIAQSDCIDVKDSYNSSILVEYSNLSDYDDIAYRDIHPINKLRIQPAHFWEQQNVREEEDYSDSKGDVITLKTKTEKQQKLSVSYFPAFMHTKLDHIFNHDFIRVAGIICKGRAAWVPIPIDRSTLYAGSVWLTEQGSILVNIGGDLSIGAEGIFDDTFDDTFE